MAMEFALNRTKKLMTPTCKLIWFKVNGITPDQDFITYRFRKFHRRHFSVSHRSVQTAACTFSFSVRHFRCKYPGLLSDRTVFGISERAEVFQS